MTHVYARNHYDADRLNTNPGLTACMIEARPDLEPGRFLTPPVAIADNMRSLTCVSCRRSLDEARRNPSPTAELFRDGVDTPEL